MRAGVWVGGKEGHSNSFMICSLLPSPFIILSRTCVNGLGMFLVPWTQCSTLSYIARTLAYFSHTLCDEYSLTARFHHFVFHFSCCPYTRSPLLSIALSSSSPCPFPWPSLLFYSRRRSLSLSGLAAKKKSWKIPLLFCLRALVGGVRVSSTLTTTPPMELEMW